MSEIGNISNGVTYDFVETLKNSGKKHFSRFCFSLVILSKPLMAKNRFIFTHLFLSLASGK